MCGGYTPSYEDRMRQRAQQERERRSAIARRAAATRKANALKAKRAAAAKKAAATRRKNAAEKVKSPKTLTVILTAPQALPAIPRRKMTATAPRRGVRMN